MDFFRWARGIFDRLWCTIVTAARRSSPQAAIPALPDHLVVAHILRSEYFDDPADLARLRAVSRAMRDTMADTGLELYELHERQASRLVCVSALERLQRAGHLSRQEYLCMAAAEGGHLKKLKQFREKGYPWDSFACMYAVVGGHLEVLRLLHTNGCPWDENSCASAAGGGNIGLLQWLRAKGCPWDKSACTSAAHGGQLELLQWLRANSCLWNEETCQFAAVIRHLEVLQWARANGCPWDHETRNSASGRVWEWALANGVPKRSVLTLSSLFDSDSELFQKRTRGSFWDNNCYPVSYFYAGYYQRQSPRQCSYIQFFCF